MRFWDMYWQPGAVARAVADAGIRTTVGSPLIDGVIRRSSTTFVPQRSPGWPRSPRWTTRSSRPRSLPTPSTRSRRPRWSGSPVSPSGSGSRSRSTSPRPRARSTTASGRTASARSSCSTRVGPARAADAARPRGLDRRSTSGELIARLGRDDRHQPGREHEARGRRRTSTSRLRARRGSRSASAPTAPGPTTRSTCSRTPSTWR